MWQSQLSSAMFTILLVIFWDIFWHKTVVVAGGHVLVPNFHHKFGYFVPQMKYHIH